MTNAGGASREVALLQVLVVRNLVRHVRTNCAGDAHRFAIKNFSNPERVNPAHAERFQR